MNLVLPGPIKHFSWVVCQYSYLFSFKLFLWRIVNWRSLIIFLISLSMCFVSFFSHSHKILYFLILNSLFIFLFSRTLFSNLFIKFYKSDILGFELYDSLMLAKLHRFLSFIYWFYHCSQTISPSHQELHLFNLSTRNFLFNSSSD